MPARTEVLRAGPIGGEESLGMSRGFEPLPPPLPLQCGRVRVLCTIIEIPVLTMFDSRQNLALSCSVALEFVGDDHTRHVRQPLEEFAKELLRRPLLPPSLHQDIQYVPVLIHRPPQIGTLALKWSETPHRGVTCPPVADDGDGADWHTVGQTYVTIYGWLQT